MEKLLQKMAEQLDSLDEASLMFLWSKYAKQACNFEPTKQWETATLIFCLLQAKHMKNQLFNHYWGTLVRRMNDGEPAPKHVSGMPPAGAGAQPGPGRERDARSPSRPCPVLKFRPLPEEGDR